MSSPYELANGASMSSAFSVIIPTADRPALLRRALDSVLGQSLTPQQIIVVDNGYVPVERFGDMPDFVEFVRTLPRIGPGRSRNIGAQHAGAEFLAFLDDDDIWDVGYLAAMQQSCERAKAKALVGRLMRSPDGKGVRREYKLFPSRPEEQRAIYFRNPGFGGQNIVIKRRLFLEVGGFDETMPASVDRDLAARLLDAGVDVAVVPEAIAVLCDHGGERVRASQVRGNWMFIRKHWRKMKIGELAKALGTFGKRWLSVRVLRRASV